MNVHDIGMMAEGALLSDLFIITCWWVMTIKDRRRDRQRLTEARAALDARLAKRKADLP